MYCSKDREAQGSTGKQREALPRVTKVWKKNAITCFTITKQGGGALKSTARHYESAFRDSSAVLVWIEAR